MAAIPSSDGYFEISYNTSIPLFSENPPTPTTSVFERAYKPSHNPINRAIKHYRVCHCHDEYLNTVDGNTLVKLRACINFMEALDTTYMQALDTTTDPAHKILKQELKKDREALYRLENPQARIQLSRTSPECFHS